MVAAPAIPRFTKTWHSEAYPAIDPARPELSTKNRLVVITGGGSGIGSHIVEAFAEAGSSEIAIIGRTLRTLQATKSNLEAKYSGLTISPFVADVSDATAIEKAFNAIAAAFKRPIDILINNAGYLPNVGSIADSNVEEWLKGFDVNLRGAFLVTRAFLKNANEGSTLVNITTGISHIPPVPGTSAYAVSKNAATKFFEYVQAENPQIRVVNLHPGVVESEMSQKSKEQSGIEWDLDDAKLPAQTAVWLTSPEAAFLKGKYVWANWDVEELKAAATKIEEPFFLTTGLIGWPTGLE